VEYTTSAFDTTAGGHTTSAFDTTHFAIAVEESSIEWRRMFP